MRSAPSRQERITYDPNARRNSMRRGRERGVWLFLPAVELRAAGFDPQGPPPQYRLWAADGGFFGRLYKPKP